MSILVESNEETVDLNQGVESSTQTPETKGDETTAAGDKSQVQIPEKFANKTTEEIVAAYTNLESELGRMRNELGDYRSMTDRFLSIEEKRMEDLGKASSEDDFHIDPTDLLADPKKVLEDFYETRRAKDPVYAEMQERLNRIESSFGNQNLSQKHPDTEQIVNDPQFQKWIQDNPYRTRIAQEAVQNNDTDAVDYLLTEWKERAGASSSSSDHQSSELETARRVSTESASSGTTANKGKRFSRRRLVELKIRNPEEYAARSEEILRAYAEGRVDD